MVAAVMMGRATESAEHKASLNFFFASLESKQKILINIEEKATFIKKTIACQATVCQMSFAQDLECETWRRTWNHVAVPSG